MCGDVHTNVHTAIRMSIFLALSRARRTQGVATKLGTPFAGTLIKKVKHPSFSKAAEYRRRRRTSQVWIPDS